MNKEEFIEILDAKLDIFKKEIKDDIEKLDKKIDMNIEKLDKKIEKELKKIKEEISTTKDIINNFINSDATGIENEIGETFKKHYIKNIMQNVKFKLFPIKKLYDCNGNIITDLNYAIVIYLKEDEKNIISFVIIEAKHKITKDKIIKKIEQIHKIKELIIKIKNNDITGCHKYFIKMLDTLKEKNIDFINFDINNILFYIGGPNWDADASNLITKIQHINNDEEELKSLLPSKSKIKLDEKKFNDIIIYLKNNIGKIEPSGDKYKIYDISTLSNDVIGGVTGGGKYTLYKMHNKL